MLVAKKPFSLGDNEISTGDVVTRELQEMLPPGRVEVLKTHRFVEEISDEHRLETRLNDLTARVEALENQANVHKKPARRRNKGAA